MEARWMQELKAKSGLDGKPVLDALKQQLVKYKAAL
jgi:hypothetical protein